MDWKTEDELVSAAIKALGLSPGPVLADGILETADIETDFDHQESHVCPDCGGNGDHEFPAAGPYNPPCSRVCTTCNGRGEVKYPNKPQKEAWLIADMPGNGDAVLFFLCEECIDVDVYALCASFTKGEDHTVECGLCRKVI